MTGGDTGAAVVTAAPEADPATEDDAVEPAELDDWVLLPAAPDGALGASELLDVELATSEPAEDVLVTADDEAATEPDPDEHAAASTPNPTTRALTRALPKRFIALPSFLEVCAED